MNILLALLLMEAAILSLKHALEVEPDFSDALLLLGHVYAREQDIETPLDLDEWLMQHEPGELDLDAANTFFLLTLAYLALEDEEMAREQWETLRERDRRTKEGGRRIECTARLHPPAPTPLSAGRRASAS